MFAATCAKCHKACEVPFRPNGERPVFCKDCFGARPSGNDYGRKDAPGRDFPKREFAPSTPKSTVEDTRIDELKRTMEAMNKKLDAIERMIGSLSPTSTTEIKKTEPTLGKVLKSVAKKAGKTKK
jgi:CxxC-x17-CxxC domain-containing protein